MNQPIVTAARGWLGTRFHHQGRVKRTAHHGGGVDCLGLLIGVADELDLRDAHGARLADLDERNYSRQPDTIKLYQQLAASLTPIPQGSIQPGDIVLLSVDGRAQHLAIISDHGSTYGMIHAYAPARAVVEHVIDDHWKSAISAAFRL